MDTRAVPGRPPDWVPVERRWHGIDRRTVMPALVALLVIATFRVVLPGIDGSIAVERETVAGDVVDLGSGVTLVPATGWSLADGLLVSDTTRSGTERVGNLDATLTHAGITVQVHTATFSGSADELLEDAKKVQSAYTDVKDQTFLASPETITTTSGLAGVNQDFSGIDAQGTLAVFTVDGIGIQVTVVGPPDALATSQDSITAMIESISKAPAEGTS